MSANREIFAAKALFERPKGESSPTCPKRSAYAVRAGSQKENFSVWLIICEWGVFWGTTPFGPTYRQAGKQMGW